MSAHDKYAICSPMHDNIYFASKQLLLKRLKFLIDNMMLIGQLYIKDKNGHWRMIPLPKEAIAYIQASRNMGGA